MQLFKPQWVFYEAPRYAMNKAIMMRASNAISYQDRAFCI